MYIQTGNEINYTSDNWRAIFDGALCLFLASIFLLPVATCFYFDGFETFESPAGALTLLGFVFSAGVTLAALGIYRTVKRISKPDRMTISPRGLSYSHYGVSREYQWSGLGDLVFVHGGKGSSGSYRMDIAGESKPLRIVPDLFGCYCDEIRAAVEGARAGQVPDISEIHANLVKQGRQMAMVFVPLIGFFVAIVLVVVVFGHNGSQPTRSRAHQSARS